jgi:hypothetical protein
MHLEVWSERERERERESRVTISLWRYRTKPVNLNSVSDLLPTFESFFTRVTETWTQSIINDPSKKVHLRPFTDRTIPTFRNSHVCFPFPSFLNIKPKIYATQEISIKNHHCFFIGMSEEYHVSISELSIIMSHHTSRYSSSCGSNCIHFLMVE